MGAAEQDVVVGGGPSPGDKNVDKRMGVVVGLVFEQPGVGAAMDLVDGRRVVVDGPVLPLCRIFSAGALFPFRPRLLSCGGFFRPLRIVSFAAGLLAAGLGLGLGLGVIFVGDGRSLLRRMQWAMGYLP